jgi:hypothetical protein
MLDQRLIDLNFKSLLHCGGRHPFDGSVEGYCISCDEQRLLESTELHLSQISHGADTHDFEEFCGEQVPKPSIQTRVLFVFESPGSRFLNGEAVPYKRFNKIPPNKTRYWLPDEPYVPKNLDEVAKAGNKYGPYLAYLIWHFKLKNAYVTNAVKCGLTVKGSNPPRFIPFPKPIGPYKEVRDNCFKLFLRTELDILPPAIIFAVGDSALRLLKTVEPSTYGHLVCLYHPAGRGSRKEMFEKNERYIESSLRDEGLT